MTMTKVAFERLSDLIADSGSMPRNGFCLECNPYMPDFRFVFVVQDIKSKYGMLVAPPNQRESVTKCNVCGSNLVYSCRYSAHSKKDLLAQNRARIGCGLPPLLPPAEDVEETVLSHAHDWRKLEYDRVRRSNLRRRRAAQEP